MPRFCVRATVQVSLALIGTVLAAADADPASLSLDALIDAASHVDGRINAAGIRQQSAAATKQIAGRWDDPVLGLEGSRTQAEDGDRTWGGRIELTQRLPLGGEGAARRAEADSQQALATAERDTARIDLAMDVRRLLVDLRLAVTMEQAARAAQAEAAAALDSVRQRIAAGSARSADLLSAQLDHDEASAAAILAQQQIHSARASLARRCGLTPDQVGDPPDIDLPIRSRDQVLVDAEQHPRLRTADAAIHAADAQLDTARSQRWSDVKVGAFGERAGEEKSIGLLLEVPLPTWNRGQAQQIAPHMAVLLSRAERAHLARQLIADAESAWFSWESARLRAELHRTRLIPAADTAHATAVADYAAGRGDLAPVLAARRARTRLASDTVHAEAERDRALITLCTTAPSTKATP